MHNLNLGCGKNKKDGFINIDFYEHPECPLDIVQDLREPLPFDDNTVSFIYSSHVIEHFTWLEGKEFLAECNRVLYNNGKLRILLPDYRKIFHKYLLGDNEFFKVFFDYLNETDLNYYKSVYENPSKVLESRKGSPPPSWHTSSDPDDRNRLRHRVRKYDHLIEVVDWFVHQYGEHKTLYDETSMRGILHEVGFSNVVDSSFDSNQDSGGKMRESISICLEAIK